MAFDATKFSRTHVGGQSSWQYRSADAIAAVIASGYFNNAYAELKKGDPIVVIDESTPTVDVIVVSSATGATTVTTVNGT